MLANPNAVFGIKWVSETYKNRFLDKTNVGFAVTTNKKFYPFGNVELVDGYDIIHPTCEIGSVPSGCSVTYKRENGEALGTLVSPIQADVPNGVKVYEADGEIEAGTIKFKPVTSIEAFKPYIVDGGTFTLTAKEVLKIKNPTPEEVKIGGNAVLTGTFQAVTPAEPVLTLQVDGDNIVFKTAAGQVSPFRAFIKGAATDAINVVLDGQATGIANVNANTDANTIYDLQGRKVNGQMRKGIYVVNGVKVIK